MEATPIANPRNANPARPPKASEIGGILGLREGLSDADGAACGDHGEHRQDHCDDRHDRALQRVGERDRPEPAEQAVDQDHHRADDDAFNPRERKLAFKGDRRGAELGGDVEDEREQHQKAGERADRRRPDAGLRSHEVGRRDVVLFGGLGAQARAEPEPDHHIAEPDARHHPQRRHADGVDEAREPEEHPGRAGGGGVGQTRHPRAEAPPAQKKIGFVGVQPRRPHADADQHQLVDDERRNDDARGRFAGIHDPRPLVLRRFSRPHSDMKASPKEGGSTKDVSFPVSGASLRKARPAPG